MKLAALATSLALVAGCAKSSDVALSRGQPNDGSSAPKPADPTATPKLAMDELRSERTAPLQVSSPAFKNGQPIPATFSDYGEKASPPLTIVAVPARTQSLVILCDDPGAAEPKPFVHWVLYNLPPNMTTLRTAIPGTGQVRQLGAAKQGANSAGSTGYYGPKPPIGDPPHHYHFQVFALDTMLNLEQGATKAQVIAAAKGHVLAAGELVGTFAKAK